MKASSTRAEPRTTNAITGATSTRTRIAIAAHQAWAEQSVSIGALLGLECWHVLSAGASTPAVVSVASYPDDQGRVQDWLDAADGSRRIARRSLVSAWKVSAGDLDAAGTPSLPTLRMSPSPSRRFCVWRRAHMVLACSDYAPSHGTVAATQRCGVLGHAAARARLPAGLRGSGRRCVRAARTARA